MTMKLATMAAIMEVRYLRYLSIRLWLTTSLEGQDRSA